MDTRCVVITGTSTGIGEACGLFLDRKGYTVFAGVRKPEDAERLKKASSANLRPILFDVSDGEQIDQAVARVRETVGGNGIHGLVNNAGISIGGPLEFLPLEMFREQLDVNVTGQIAVTQAFLPLLREGNGRIVFVSSTSGRNTFPLTGAYSASKFALEAIAHTFRVELRPWNIHVSLIVPGSVKTSIWDKSLARADKMIGKLPEEAQHFYGDIIQSVRGIIVRRGNTGIQPEAAARIVHRALIDKRPKAQYFVGLDARVLSAFAKYVPDRIQDALIYGLFGFLG